MADVVCAACGASPRQAFTCSACHSEVYCGQACLRDHWARGHREICLALRAHGDGAEQIGDAIDVLEFAKLRTVKAVRDAIEEIKRARLVPGSTAWSENKTVINVMARIMNRQQLENDVTREQLLQLAKLVDSPQFVRRWLLYGFEHNGASAAEVRFRRALEWLTQVLLDPLIIEYTEPTTMTPVFPRSLRPQTYMHLADKYIREASINTVPPTDWRMPVVRYMVSLERGAFYDGGADPRACGVFLFFEPDAKTVIHLPAEQVLVCANKPHAVIRLLELEAARTPSIDPWDAQWNSHSTDTPRNLFVGYAELFREKKMFAVADGIFARIMDRNGLTTTMSEIPPCWRSVVSAPTAEERFFSVEKEGQSWHFNERHKVDHTFMWTDRQDNYRYMGYELTGRFDDLDAIICALARRHGYSTVVLQSEPGRRRCVTEVYYTLDRLDAFRSIIRDMTLPPEAVKDVTQPCVWYP